MINIANNVVMGRPVENTTAAGLSSVRSDDRREPMRLQVLQIGEGKPPTTIKIGMILVAKAFMDYKVNIQGNDRVFVEFKDILCSYEG